MLTATIDEDIELRLLREENVEDLFELVDGDREYLRRWLPWVDGNATVEDTRVFIVGCEGRRTSGIWYRGALVGVISFHAIDVVGGKVEIGYWLGSRLQGRGIMTRACRAMIDHAFAGLGMKRVEIHCAAENERSRAIPERLGFVEEGTIREGQQLHGRFVDVVVYGLLSPEWRETTPR